MTEYCPSLEKTHRCHFYCQGIRNDIENYLNSCIEFGSKNNNWIFNLGHGVLPKTNPQMLDYLIKFVKGYY